MIKLFLLFTMLINKPQTDFLVKEEKIIKNQIVETSEEYSLVKDNETQILMKGQTKIITLSLNAKVKWLIHLHKLVIVYVDKQQMVIVEADLSGRVITQKPLLNRYSEDFNLLSFEDKLYLVGGVSYYQDIKFKEALKDYHQNEDAFIALLDDKYEFSDVKIYGGSLKDRFTNIQTDGTYLYVTGSKDTLSGGDFGNAGNINQALIISKLDLNLNLIKYQCFKDEKFLEYKLSDQKVFYLTTEYIYRLGKDLNLEMSLKFDSECRFGYFSNNYTLFTLNKAEGQIYDLEHFDLLHNFKIEEGYERVIVDKDAFILNYKGSSLKLKIYDIRAFQEEVNYGQELNQTINNLFTDLKLSNQEITPFFDPLVYGTYDVNYQYGDLNLTGKINVIEEVNLTDGLVYPFGYKLSFTGVAYLDGVLINNNHSLMKTGNHELVLFGCNCQKKVINFIVDKDQMVFEEYSNKHWDLEVYPDEQFQVTFNLNNPEDYKIKEVIINGISYQDFKYENNQLTINISENTSGIYHYVLEEVVYEVNEQKLSLSINDDYVVNVLKNKLKLNAVFNNQDLLNYLVTVDDSLQEIRGLRLKLISGGEETSFFYTLKDSDLIIRGLNPQKQYQATVCLVIHEGGLNLKEVELFSLQLDDVQDDIRIGAIDIMQKGESLEQFAIQLIKSENLSQVNNLGQVVYVYIKPNHLSKIIYGIVLGIIAGGIIIFLRIKKQKHPFPRKLKKR